MGCVECLWGFPGWAERRLWCCCRAGGGEGWEWGGREDGVERVDSGTERGLIGIGVATSFLR